MTGAALAPSPDVAALEGLPINEVNAALGHVWQSFGRRTVVDAWHIGRSLRRVKGRDAGASVCALLRADQDDPFMAYQLLALVDGSLAQVSCHRTVDGAVKALKAAPEPTEQAPAVATPAPAVTAAPSPVATAQTDEEVIEAVAAEVEMTPAEQRDERLEWLAIITEDMDGPVVDHWAAKHAEAAATHRRDAQRHREDVATINAEQRATATERRKNTDIRDALLAIPSTPGVADVLAQFWNAAKPEAA